MSSLTEKQVLYFLVEFILLILTARVLADLMRRWKQASVIGELLAGIVLGPSILGRVWPGLHNLIFPPDPVVNHLLEASAWIGVIMLLLCTGLETDLDTLKSTRRPAMLVSSFGIAIPLAAGFFVAWYLPDGYLVAANRRLIFAMFFAVAMSISAVPVIARILIDLDLMRRELGLLILAAGILDDSVGWLLLSVVAGLASRGVVDLRTLTVTMTAAVAFLAFCYFLGFRIASKILRWVDDYAYADHASITAMVGLAFVCAVITQAIGIHALFGAFLAGVMIGHSARTRDRDREQLQAVTMGILAPIFFAYSGLKADIFAVKSIEIPALIIGIACMSKFLGCGLGGILSGLGKRESFAVAAGMNARGGMGIVVALIGLALGVLTPEMYTIILIMAILTSVIAPPLLEWSLGAIPESPGDEERTEREKALGKLPFTREGAKLLVLDAGGPHARMATHLAAALGNHHEASITIFRVTPAEMSEKARADLKERFAELKAIAESCGAQNVLERTAAGDSPAALILEEVGRGYDAVFAGASHLSRGDRLGGAVLGELLRESPTPVLVARGYRESFPFQRILAPTTGASYSVDATALAMLYAQSTKASVSALYVMENANPLHNFLSRTQSPQPGHEMIGQINELAEQLSLTVETKVDSATKAERVILQRVESGRFDLLMMGVLHRPIGERAYFGPKVERIFRDADCAVAVFVSAAR